MISAAPCVRYIHEPFNIGEHITPNPQPFTRWFQHIDANTEKVCYEVFQKILSYQYPVQGNLSRVRSLKDMMHIVRDSCGSMVGRASNSRPLVKDPIALFSAEWLYERFDMDVVCMIRHPAAFCASLRVKNWEFDFNNFLSQPVLMDKHLSSFRTQMEESVRVKPSVIEQGILLWNCIHHVIGKYRNNYGSWLFVRHEDLSIDPVANFGRIYEQLGLDFTRHARQKIIQSSGSHNPVEALSGSELLRNSIANIKNWKNRLTPAEIYNIKVQTRQVAREFYGEEDW